MENITLTVNNRTVSAKQGTTILELARDMGLYIPTLCYHESLTPAGACRICIVEEETRGELLPACSTTVTPGMSIQTDSPLVIENRKTILELMLANHAQSCLVCSKGNACELRSLASKYGIGKIRFYRMPQGYYVKENNPFMMRDMTRCILCAKCIRADQELVVGGVLGYLNRGFDCRPATLLEKSLEEAGCTFCGTCLDLCPTGAISELGRPFGGNVFDFKEGVCNYCGCGCSLLFGIVDNEIVEVRPNENDSVNSITICARGRFGFDYVSSENRIKKPLLRENGNWHPISYKEALEVIESNLSRIASWKEKDSIGILYGANLTCEEGLYLEYLGNLLNTSYISNGTDYINNIFSGMHEALGFIGATKPISYIDEVDTIVVIGSRVNESVPVLSYAIKRAVSNRGAKFIFIDPAWSDMVSMASYWLEIRPESDTALFTGISKVLIEQNEGLFNECKKWEGWGEFLAYLKKESLKELARRCNLEEDPFFQVASLFNSSKKIAFIFGKGVTSQRDAREAIISIINLYLLLGGAKRAALYPTINESNGFGLGLMGAKAKTWLGFPKGGREPIKRSVSEAIFASDTSVSDILEQAATGALGALLLFQYDPIISFSHLDTAKKALEKTRFVMAYDMFMGPCCEMADLILPAPASFEQSGTFINMERRVQSFDNIIEPPFDFSIRSIVGDIDRYIGSKGDSNIEDSLIQDELDLLSHLKYWPDNKEELEYDSSARFIVPKIKSDTRKDQDYPYILVMGNILFHYGRGIRTHNARRLHEFVKEPYLLISTADGDRFALKDGDKVRVISPFGQIEVKVSLKKEMREGTVILSRSFPIFNWNRLFSDRSSSIWVPVKLEKARG